MKKMKKLIALLLAASMVGAMGACSGGNQGTTDNSSSTTEEGNTDSTESSVAPIETNDEGLEPQDGGVLVIAQSASPAKLDPVDYTGYL